MDGQPRFEGELAEILHHRQDERLQIHILPQRAVLLALLGQC